MRGRVTAIVVLLVLPALAAETIRGEAVGLRFSVPRAWERVPTPAEVRAAQWKVHRAPGDPEDAEVVLFFFGVGKGGSAQENLDRWFGEFPQPNGGASRDAAVVATRTANGLKVTSLDLSGTYKPGPPPDGPLPPPKRGFRILAAVVEGDDGPWFLRAIGPEKTIAATKSGFDATLASLTPHR